MLTFIAVVSTLCLLVSCVDLVSDFRAARPLRRGAAVKRAAEHGVAYAEQLARRREMPSHEKFQHALSCARDELLELKVKFRESELGRAIEISISAAKPDAPAKTE